MNAEKGKPEKTLGRKATGPRLFRDAFCDATKDPKIAGLPIVLANPVEELTMRKILIFCLPVLLCAGVLIASTGFAADKFYVEADEIFDPLGILGPAIGELLVPPSVKCPGHEPTENPEQPCPAGSRTHLRNTLLKSRVDSSNLAMSGDMYVVLNSNMDAEFAGPVWGTFIIELDAGGTWEGTWQGLRVFVVPSIGDPFWTATLHFQGKGFGGEVDGMKLMGVDEIFSPTPTAIAYTGEIEGRVIDPN